MRDDLARSAVMTLVAAGLFLALPAQDATARGGSSGVTSNVNSSFQPAHRMIKQRFGRHGKLSGRAHGGQRHRVHALHSPFRQRSDKAVIGTLGYPVAPASTHKHYGPETHPGAVLIIVSEEAKQGPIVPPFSGVVTRSVEAGGVVVFRGPAVPGFDTAKTAAGSGGGKLILISP